MLTTLAMRALILSVAVAAIGCTDELDPPWQLDHDRIVAVRATPPGLVPGEQSTLDALLSLAGGKTLERPPELATVVSPRSLMGALAFTGGAWTVTAPDEAQLAAARAELKLEAGKPVPLVVGVSFQGQSLFATKTVWLGEQRWNPTLDAMTIDGAPADGKTEIVVGTLVDIPLSVAADEEDDINWLTSCGTMHDFDLPQAYLRVEEKDPKSGELAVVRRDELGGVAWRVWPIRAE